jgi:hypothetical protein
LYKRARGVCGGGLDEVEALMWLSWNFSAFGGIGEADERLGGNVRVCLNPGVFLLLTMPWPKACIRNPVYACRPLSSSAAIIRNKHYYRHGTSLC